ncbi:hypothetical protein KS4_23240 [Poriferisphaera corsica]|uniref:Uncharacterized protein n=1 Tax=Poriferisphaera corsica TaxID=2528020 RepID=A0A517YVJ3_9BACT|nr:hypothetical protein KS4_23240 [Poriferisphaera corsica]
MINCKSKTRFGAVHFREASETVLRDICGITDGPISVSFDDDGSPKLHVSTEYTMEGVELGQVLVRDWCKSTLETMSLDDFEARFDRESEVKNEYVEPDAQG